jgi:hypothetical protein
MMASLGWLHGSSSLRFHFGVEPHRLEELVTRGWARLAGHLDQGGRAALAKPGTLPWSRMAPRVGIVTQHGWFAQMPFQQAPPPVQALGSLIRTTVSTALDQKLPDWNEVTWQRYEQGSGHIDPHRDQAYYSGLILIVTLLGEAELSAPLENEAIVPGENEATQTDWLGDLSGGLGADPAAGR